MSKYEFQRNLAVLIGINNYSNGIPELETPVADAQKLAAILQDDYKYEVQILLDEKATLEKLKSLLEGFKKKRLPNETVQIKENDRLIFYFAGHGIVPADGLENQGVPLGYLVPQDARGDILLQKQIENNKILLPMQDLHDSLAELPCRHLLVILDCCFAGAFRSSLYREIAPARKMYRQRYDRFIKDRAWQAIASAAHDQKAIDYLGCFGQRGNIGKHSPFAEALFEGLRGAADTTLGTGDGIITATKLYCYLRDKVEELTDEHDKRQTPGLFPLKKHDKGEYIFLLPNFDQNKLEDAPALNEENNPYRGLKSYEEEHSQLFFGRDELVRQLYARVCKPENPLTAVLAVSGSGKSSLVKAGLIPYLRANHLEEWYIIPAIRPGESPFAALAEAIVGNIEITRSKVDAINSLTKTLKQAPSQFTDIIANWRQIPANARLLLVIDQFEELITTCKQKEREQFLNFLAEVLEANSQKLHIILTLRSDFEPRFLDSALKSYWIGDRFPVRAMRSDELRQAIERPANEKMLDFKPPNLVDQLIEEVGQMPGALSLLSFTLSELYTRCIQRESRTLTEADYKDLGGVAGSLTHRATEVYNKLDKAQQITMRRVMLRMVTIEGGESARRRVPESELVYIDDAENKRVEEVIKRLDKARLIVGGRETGGEPYVEPAHDALVRGWNKLQDWKNEEQENLLLQKRLTPAANDWHINNRPSGLLLPDGDRLNQLERILVSSDNWLNQRETDFINSSIADKVRQRQRTLARRLSAQAQSVRTEDDSLLERSVLLAIEAKKRGLEVGMRILQADQTLRQGMALLLRPITRLTFKSNVKNYYHVPTFSSDGKYIVTITDAIRLSEVTSGREVVRINYKEKVTPSPDGKYIATYNLNTVQVRELLSNQKVRILHNENVTDVLFSQNSKYIAVFSEKGTRVWQMSNERIVTPTKLPTIHGELSFSGNEKYLAEYTKEGVQVWEIASSQKVLSFSEGFVRLSDFSSNGEYLATTTSEKVTLWNVSSGSRKELIEEGAFWVITSICLSPDGKYLAMGNRSGVVSVIETISAQEVASIKHSETWVKLINFSHNGKYLVVGGGNTDSFTRIVEIPRWNEVARVSRNMTDGFIFSPDGNYLAGYKDNSEEKHEFFTIWEIPRYSEVPIVQPAQKLYDLAFSRDGKYLAVTFEDGITEIREADNGRQFVRLKHEAFVNTIFTPDGKFIASLGGHEQDENQAPVTIRIWELGSERDVVQIPTKVSSYGFNLDNIVFSPDSKHLIILESEDWANLTIKIWDINTGIEIKQIPINSPDKLDWINKANISSNGKYIALGSELEEDKSLLTVQEISSDKEVTRIQIEARWSRLLRRFVFSSDGNYIAGFGGDRSSGTVTNTWDGIIQVWQISSSRKVTHIELERLVSDVAFSPDSKFLAARTTDGTTRVWDLTSHQEEVARIKTSSSFNPLGSAVSFSPDGKYLITTDRGEEVRVWFWQPEYQVVEACSRLTRNLTPEEWEQYLPGEPYCKTCPNLP